ncbi:hypothetical protein TPHA_0P00570 [Tetrapisispora phaffii CBS 4417]|uniref:Choline/carnitine acyltransferase domain-containing protein n=1 Tax=Tetrapisispora phaffii (strain ATCC 24235 / CBS 4417 / NBRC 1672 / NRRL Y-8282 / UCD 70-5) TaxID=1071381 RepID=G8C237_TETPH|nr:hypothetical protein TPHA_0P00570 [Tetrapisispora phaffii CBS 4417]CCE66215.1 hypothetical protein TPHA_0P00570 [Tetrapisispora phaffii CBS 4417]
MSQINDVDNNNDLLQRLPIPNLNDTLNRYYKRIEPLQDDKQNKLSFKKIFSNENIDILNDLNNILISYDQKLSITKPKSSYIEKFWYDAYLLYDESVVLNLNPFFQLADDPTLNSYYKNYDYFYGKDKELNPDIKIKTNEKSESESESFYKYGEFTLQIKRTTKLILSILKFIKEIRNNKLKPDLIKNKAKLSMDQYEKLFGSSRIPSSNTNTKEKKYSCNLQTDKTSHHIIIMYRSQFYWFDVLNINNDLIFEKSDDLEYNLFSIIKDYEKNETFYKKNISPIGIFTTENRKVWSNVRDYIKNDQKKNTNYKNLKLIDSALFIVCLDDISIEDDNELSKSMLCGTSNINLSNNINNYKNPNELILGLQNGTCLNRWYDKLQLIVTKNGKAGINFEHTGVDGHTVLRLASDIYTDSILSFATTITNNVPTIFESNNEKMVKKSNKLTKNILNSNLITIPRKLEWKLDSFLTSSLHFAETRLSDLISQYDLETLEFSGYGSTLIKKIFKCSPDAFTQQIFQLAYYALYGRFETVYEPAMTKTFQNGRTEAIRSVTNESKLFVKSIFDASSNDLDRIAKLQKACSEHSRITKECSMGLGQDRHLYALYSIYNEYFKDTKPTPPIFQDKSWYLLNTTILSTSNCGNPCLKSFGFGPTSPNGFGIGYIIRENSISIVVSSRHRQTKRFSSLIEKSFLEIKHIFHNQFNPVDKSTDLNGNSVKLASMNAKNSLTTKKSEDLRYLLSGYDYFDVNVVG